MVEDDLDMQISLSTILRRHGYEVLAVTDGVTARKLLADHAFDVVTLDLKLPDVDGTDLLASGEELPPVIVVSAFAYFDQIELESRFGSRVSSFIRKPAPPRVILEAVAQARRRRESEDGRAKATGS